MKVNNFTAQEEQQIKILEEMKFITKKAEFLREIQFFSEGGRKSLIFLDHIFQQAEGATTTHIFTEQIPGWTHRVFL